VGPSDEKKRRFYEGSAAESDEKEVGKASSMKALKRKKPWEKNAHAPLILLWNQGGD